MIVPHLIRIRDNGTQTMSRLHLYDDDEIIFKCVALEPSWILNEPYVSCIDIGVYPIVKRESQKFGKHLHIKEVEGREFILIHTLNFYKQTEGCIGVGKRFGYINEDHQIDISSSRDTLNKVLGFMPDETKINIYKHGDFQAFYE